MARDELSSYDTITRAASSPAPAISFTKTKTIYSSQGVSSKTKRIYPAAEGSPTSDRSEKSGTSSGYKFLQSEEPVSGQLSGDLFVTGLNVPKRLLKLEKMEVITKRGDSVLMSDVVMDQLCVVVFLRHFGCLVC